MMNDILEQILAFRNARDWAQYHTPRNLAISLSLEAAEVLEVFQWKRDEALTTEDVARLSEEVADVLYYLLLLAHTTGIDLQAAVEAKLKINDARYPIDKAKGTATKYTKFD